MHGEIRNQSATPPALPSVRKQTTEQPGQQGQSRHCT